MANTPSKRPGRVTQADIAADLGVSQTLVSLTYRGADGVGADTRERILAAGRRLGYVHDINAARLAGRTPRTIGLFLRDLRLAVTADLLDGVNAVAEERDVDLILAVGHPDGARDRKELENLLRAGADVVIAAGTLLPDDVLVDFLGPRRLVCLTRRVQGIDSVYTDDDAGAEAVVDHLVQLGHRRIAHLAWPLDTDIDTRARGYERAMRRHGLEPDLVGVGFTSDDGRAAAGAMLDREADRRPTAIFAAHDLIAMGALDALAERGMTAPADCSLVGYDDTPPAHLLSVSLTSVDQHARELGRHAAELAVARLTAPDAETVDVCRPVSLIARGSSGRPPV